MLNKPKPKRKREPFYPMPLMVPGTPENIARVATRVATRAAKDGWAYEREYKAKRGGA